MWFFIIKHERVWFLISVVVRFWWFQRFQAGHTTFYKVSTPQKDQAKHDTSSVQHWKQLKQLDWFLRLMWDTIQIFNPVCANFCIIACTYELMYKYAACNTRVCVCVRTRACMHVCHTSSAATMTKTPSCWQCMHGDIYIPGIVFHWICLAVCWLSEVLHNIEDVMITSATVLERPLWSVYNVVLCVYIDNKRCHVQAGHTDVEDSQVASTAVVGRFLYFFFSLLQSS